MTSQDITNNNINVPGAASYTPMSQKGTSLQPGVLSFDAGLVSNISTLGRASNMAAVLDCFQMIVPGIWSTDGIGWQPQRAAIFNSGNAFQELSYYIDNTGTRTPIYQNGVGLWSYNLSTTIETSISLPGGYTITLGTQPPTFKRFFSNISGESGVVYCNGVQQPLKIISTSSSALLGFNITFPALTPTPTVTTSGATGATAYSYKVVANFPGAIQTTSATVAISNGNATLSGSNFNVISFLNVFGATSYTIYRIAGGATQGIIAASVSPVLNSTVTFNDTGIAATTATAPVGTPAVPVSVTGSWGANPYFGNPLIQGANLVYKTYNKPKFAEIFAGRMWYGGFPDTTTAFDIISADYSQDENFTVSSPPAVTDSIAFSFPPELGKLTAMRRFRASNLTTSEILVCGCTNGIFYIQGTDSSSFQLIVLTYEVGVASNRCFIDINDDCIFLSTQGFRFFSSIASNTSIRTATVSYGINDLINQIDPANWQYAHAIHNLPTAEIQFWVPLLQDSGQCQHAFILNYNNGATAAGSFTPVWSTKSQTALSCSMYWQQTSQMFGGGYGAGTSIPTDGLLQLHYTGNTYNGQPIRASARTALAYLNPQQKCSLRCVTPVMDGGGQSWQLSAYVYTRTGGGGFQRRLANPSPFQITLDQNASTALNTWELNTGAFPGNNAKTRDFTPLGNGIFWDFELNTSTIVDQCDFSALYYTFSGGSMQR